MTEEQRTLEAVYAVFGGQQAWDEIPLQIRKMAEDVLLRPEFVAAVLRRMTEEQRAKTMELVDWCSHCYRLDPRCQCSNDE